MKNELLQLFNNEKSNNDFITELSNPKWCAKLAYLTGIFNHLNNLNLRHKVNMKTYLQQVIK